MAETGAGSGSSRRDCHGTKAPFGLSSRQVVRFHGMKYCCNHQD